MQMWSKQFLLPPEDIRSAGLKEKHRPNADAQTTNIWGSSTEISFSRRRALAGPKNTCTEQPFYTKDSKTNTHHIERKASYKGLCGRPHSLRPSSQEESAEPRELCQDQLLSAERSTNKAATDASRFKSGKARNEREGDTGSSVLKCSTLSLGTCVKRAQPRGLSYRLPKIAGGTFLADPEGEVNDVLAGTRVGSSKRSNCHRQNCIDASSSSPRVLLFDVSPFRLPLNARDNDGRAFGTNVVQDGSDFQQAQSSRRKRENWVNNGLPGSRVAGSQSAREIAHDHVRSYHDSDTIYEPTVTSSKQFSEPSWDKTPIVSESKVSREPSFSRVSGKKLVQHVLAQEGRMDYCENELAPWEDTP